MKPCLTAMGYKKPLSWAEVAPRSDIAEIGQVERQRANDPQRDPYTSNSILCVEIKKNNVNKVIPLKP